MAPSSVSSIRAGCQSMSRGSAGRRSVRVRRRCQRQPRVPWTMISRRSPGGHRHRTANQKPSRRSIAATAGRGLLSLRRTGRQPLPSGLGQPSPPPTGAEARAQARRRTQGLPGLRGTAALLFSQQQPWQACTSSPSWHPAGHHLELLVRAVPVALEGEDLPQPAAGRTGQKGCCCTRCLASSKRCPGVEDAW